MLTIGAIVSPFATSITEETPTSETMKENVFFSVPRTKHKVKAI